jgi:hypothetical protein
MMRKKVKRDSELWLWLRRPYCRQASRPTKAGVVCVCVYVCVCVCCLRDSDGRKFGGVLYGAAVGAALANFEE